MLTTERVWFPLRSNLGTSAGGRRVGLESRLKHAALLAGEVWLEPGRLSIVITPGRVWSSLTDRDSLTVRDGGSRRDRDEALLGRGREGEAESTAGRDADELLQSATIDFRPITRRTGLDRARWVKWPEPTLSQEVLASAIAEASLARREHVDAISETDLVDEYLRDSLSRDVAVATVLGAATGVDERFGPLLRYEAAHVVDGNGESGRTAGSAVLLPMPNVEELPWGQINELRDHEIVQRFREQVIEARTLLPTIEGGLDDLLDETNYLEVLGEICRLVSSASSTSSTSFQPITGLALYGGTTTAVGPALPTMRRQWSAFVLVRRVPEMKARRLA